MTAEDKIYEAIAENIVKELFSRIDSGANWLIKKWRDAGENYSVFVGDAFKLYYKGAIPKYTKTKTLLYRSEPRSVSDYVEASDLLIRDWNGRIDTTLPAATINELLDYSKRAVISGMAGSGKSTLLRDYFLKAVQQGSIFPIFYELRRLNSEGSIKLENCIWEEFKSYGATISRETFFETVKAGKFCIFLDGFDEVVSKNVSAVEEEINELGFNYRECPIIVTSRPRTDGFARLQEYTEISIAPLQLTQAKSLVTKLGVDEATTIPFLHDLEVDLFRRYHEFSSNPLLLTLMLITYHEYGQVPAKQYLLYEQVVETLSWRHDRMKQSYQRELKGGLETDKLKYLLEGLAVQTYLDERPGYSEAEMMSLIEKASVLTSSIENIDVVKVLEDLTGAISVIVKDGRKYRFLHRSFEEYFTARYMCRMDASKAEQLFDKVSKRVMTDEVIQIAVQVNQVLLEKIIWNKIEPLLEKSGFIRGEVVVIDESLSTYCEEFLETLFDSADLYPDDICLYKNELGESINTNILAILCQLPRWYKDIYPDAWESTDEALKVAIGSDRLNRLRRGRWRPSSYDGGRRVVAGCDGADRVGIGIGRLLGRTENRQFLFDYFKDLLFGFGFALKLRERIIIQQKKRAESEKLLFD